MSTKDKHEQQEEQQEQTDLEVSEEQADEVEGGTMRIKYSADRDSQGVRGTSRKARTMSEQEQPKQQDEQQEQADLEVSEEQADEVEGGASGWRWNPDRDPKGTRAHF